MCITLCAIYESFIAILTISALPSANVTLLNRMMAANDLDVIAMIGLVFPRGIIGKNAIMMIDLACSATRDASYQARCPLLRAMLMATMAAILGMLPLILGAGIGPELCRLLGLATVRQVLPLFTTPYFYFDRIVTGLNPLAGGPSE